MVFFCGAGISFAGIPNAPEMPHIPLREKPVEKSL